MGIPGVVGQIWGGHQQETGQHNKAYIPMQISVACRISRVMMLVMLLIEVIQSFTSC